MSAAFGQSRRSRSRSGDSNDDYAKKSVLAKVKKSELKMLRVAVKRSNVIGGAPQLALDRSIDDPAKICSYVHYRKDRGKLPEPPIFGRGIKVNQDFTENRRVFTDEYNDKTRKSLRKSRSRSRYRSRSPRNRARSPSKSKRAKSQKRDRTESPRGRSSLRRSKSRGRSTSRRKRRSSRRNSSRSSSKHRSRSRERRYSSERRRYKDSRRSPSPRSRSPCPVHGNRDHKKSLTPLRPGEYRPGHPDLALRNKRPRSRSRSRSYEDRSRSEKSRSRDNTNLPSTNRDKTSSERHASSSRANRKYDGPVKNDERERRSKSRSPVKIDRYRRRSRSPYSSHSSTNRSYKGVRNKNPRRRSRSPQYGGPHPDNLHGDYEYYEGWGPGPRLPAGRGGFPMQPFYPPAFHPRGMMPGALIPPGLMLVPRVPIMPPYRPYRPHYPVYNSGAVGQRGSRPSVKPATITSEKADDDSVGSRVVITEVNSHGSEHNEEPALTELRDTVTDKTGERGEVKE